MDIEDIIKDTEAYRDSIGTIREDGKRNFLHPKKPKGKFYNRRTIVATILLTLLFVLPFIKVNGHALCLFNVLERKFILFGLVFWPQDFNLFVLAAISGVVFIMLFTVAFGRVWCGWACPQTIFMEMVFRKIEYWLEGDYGQQKKLNKMPWNAEKIRKRGLKLVIFYIISFLIANIFLAYIIGSDALIEIITDNPSKHVSGLIAIVVFSSIFFFVFVWFREQACIVVCPYGRLQGVLLDKKSIQVSYDYIRGEDRGRFRKNEDREATGKGDCIDCSLCVAVCPTGIDIRNGSQLECVNCTACIDACDSVMHKVNKPKGLIRYASEENIAEKKPFTFNTRMKAYTIVLSILLIALFGFLGTRSDVEFSMLRVPGQLYQRHEGDSISNLYNYKFINKTYDELPVRIELIEPEGRILFIGETKEMLEGQGAGEGTMFIYLSEEILTGRKTKIKIGLYSGDRMIESVRTNFNGPVK